MTKSRKLKLFHRCYNYLIKLIKEEHLICFKNDIKCSCCNVWFSISGINHKHTYESHKTNDDIFVAKCGQCGTTTFWNCVIAPVLIRCDEEGNPIND